LLWSVTVYGLYWLDITELLHIVFRKNGQLIMYNHPKWYQVTTTQSSRIMCQHIMMWLVELGHI